REPTQKFGFVAFGNGRDLISVVRQKIVGRRGGTGQYIPLNNPGGISFDSGIQDRTHSLPRDGPEVLGSLHAATRERHHAVGTVAAFAKQPTDNNHVLRMHVPHYLSFSDRVEVVNLDTHVTCRVRPLNG